MSLGLILIILLVIFLLGGFGPRVWSGAPWQYGYGWGSGGMSIGAVLLIILVVLILTHNLSI
jgi:hypothetical protein